MSVISEKQFDSVAGLTCFPHARTVLATVIIEGHKMKRDASTKYIADAMHASLCLYLL